MRKLLSLLLLSFVVLVFFVSCDRQEKKAAPHTYCHAQRSSVPTVISVYRFGTFSESKARRLANGLKEYFPNVELRDEVLPLPQQHYYKPLNRYLGAGLFDSLKKARGKKAALGLTDYVIYKPNDKSPTYGIMGVSPVGSYICVLSDMIPKSLTRQTDENLVKLALHELGHAFGLNHCPDQHCFMVDAEHTMKLPQSHYFCPKCKAYLNKKGWL